MAERTISLDPNSDVSRNLDAGLGEIIQYLQTPNKIEGRKLSQLLPELQAGKQYVKAPKAKIVILDELLAKPMRQIRGQQLPMNVRDAVAKFLKWYQLEKAGRKATRER